MWITNKGSEAGCLDTATTETIMYLYIRLLIAFFQTKNSLLPFVYCWNKSLGEVVGVRLFLKIFFCTAFVTVFQLPRGLNNAYRLNFPYTWIHYLHYCSFMLRLKSIRQLSYSFAVIPVGRENLLSWAVFFLVERKAIMFLCLCLLQTLYFLEYISPQRD